MWKNPEEEWNQALQRAEADHCVTNCVYNKFSKPSKYLISSFVSFLVAVTWARSAPLSRVPPVRRDGEEHGLVSWTAAGNPAKFQPAVSFVVPGTRLSRFRVHCFCCLLFSHPIRLAVPRAFSRAFLEVVKLRHVVYLQWADIWRLFNFLTDRTKWTYALYIVAMFNNEKKNMTEKAINLLTTFRRVCLVNNLYKCKEE